MLTYPRLKNEKEASYMPMVKFENKIYLWRKDLENIDISKMEKVGEINFSHKSLNKKLEPDDPNFSSNLFSVESKLYRYDDKGLVIEFDGNKSLLIYR